MAKRENIPEDAIKKNFWLSPETCKMLKELADSENHSEKRIVTEAIEAYFLGKRMQENLLRSKSFDQDAFVKSLGEVMLDGLEKRNLVVPVDKVKTE